eukprot:snap_masked-scaffold_32-processed-gene-1.14-mRNA-1 protein AED:1.00 eAED:1.00 QI:0/0/0/0/1/1/2/0/364
MEIENNRKIPISEWPYEEKKEYMARASRKYRQRKKNLNNLEKELNNALEIEVGQARHEVEKLKQHLSELEKNINQEKQSQKDLFLIKKNEMLREKVKNIQMKNFLNYKTTRLREIYPLVETEGLLFSLRNSFQTAIYQTTRHGEIKVNNQLFQNAGNRFKLRKKINLQFEEVLTSNMRMKISSLSIDKEFSKFLKYTGLVENISFDEFYFAVVERLNSESYFLKYKGLYEYEPKILDISSKEVSFWNLVGLDGKKSPFQRIVLDKFRNKETDYTFFRVHWYVKEDDVASINFVILYFDPVNKVWGPEVADFNHLRLMKHPSKQDVIKLCMFDTIGPTDRLNEIVSIVQSVALKQKQARLCGNFF